MYSILLQFLSPCSISWCYIWNYYQSTTQLWVALESGNMNLFFGLQAQYSFSISLSLTRAHTHTHQSPSVSCILRRNILHLFSIFQYLQFHSYPLTTSEDCIKLVVMQPQRKTKWTPFIFSSILACMFECAHIYSHGNSTEYLQNTSPMRWQSSERDCSFGAENFFRLNFMNLSIIYNLH